MPIANNRVRESAERGPHEAGLSIVVPCFNEAGNLPSFHKNLVEIARQLKDKRKLRCEVVYVDDGSRDDTFAVASALPAKMLDVQVVSLSRNFGKEAALMAGLHHARFGAVLFMDGDGQHPAALIDRLVGHWLEDGYDVIYTAKANRTNESLGSPAGREAVLRADQFPRPPQDSGRCRRFPIAFAARRQGLAAIAGAQSFLQRAGELDRLPPDARGL